MTNEIRIIHRNYLTHLHDNNDSDIDNFQIQTIFKIRILGRILDIDLGD